MTQLETIEAALAIVGEPDEDDPLDVGIHEVLTATMTVKRWEAEENDASECECEQCVAAVTLAQAIIKIAEGDRQ